MKSRTTLVLLVITLLVAGLVALDFQRGTTTDEAAARRRNIVELDINTIQRVDLIRTNETIVIEKQGDDWQITEPIDVPADYSIVRSIFDELEFAQRDRTITSEELQGIALSDFGLATPRVTVTLSGADDPVTVRLGAETPTRDAVYLQVAGRDEVYVVNLSVATRLDHDLHAIRNRQVLKLAPSGVVRLQIKAADRLTEFVKDDGAWKIQEPFAARANQQALNDLLRDLSYLQVQEFVSDDPNDLVTYGLNEPRHEISVWESDAGDAQVLLVGGNPTNDTTTVFAKRKAAPSIFTIPNPTIEKAIVPLNELRDPKVFDFQSDEVMLIRVQRGLEEIAATRTAAGWELTTPGPIPAESGEITRFLDQLRGLEIEEFTADVAADLEPFGLAVPPVIVTLQGSATNDVTQLLLGATKQGPPPRLHVTRADEPFVYGVSPDLMNWIPTEARSWRARRVTEMDPASIERLEITNDGQTRVLARDENQVWQLIEPAEGVIDTEMLDRLVTTLASLRAEEFSDPATPEDELVDQWQIVLTHAGQTLALGLEPSGQAGLWTATWSDPPLRFSILVETAEILTSTVVTVVE